MDPIDRILRLSKWFTVVGLLATTASNCIAQGYSAENQCYCHVNPLAANNWFSPENCPPHQRGNAHIGIQTSSDNPYGQFYPLNSAYSECGNLTVPCSHGPSFRSTWGHQLPQVAVGQCPDGRVLGNRSYGIQHTTPNRYDSTCASEIRPRQTGCGAWRLCGGFEALVLRAHYDQNVAMIIDPLPGNDQVPFDYGYSLSPRVWLGTCSSANGGFRTSYWYFQDTADRETATAVVGATPVYLYVYGAGGNLTRNAYADLGETLTSIHNTRVQSLDFEFFDSICYRNWNMQPTAGLRLADIDLNLRGDVYDSLGGLEETVTNELNVRGAGPTASARINRMIRCSPYSLYGNIRGSLLFSQTKQEIYEMKNAGANQVIDRARHDEILSVFEMGLGLQYNYCCASGLNTIAGVGYQLQAWHDVGGPVDSSSTLGLNGLTAGLGLNF